MGWTVNKLIINIILEQIKLWYEAQLSEEQNGFRRNRVTTDDIFREESSPNIESWKTTLISFCGLNNSIRLHIEGMVVQLN